MGMKVGAWNRYKRPQTQQWTSDGRPHACGPGGMDREVALCKQNRSHFVTQSWEYGHSASFSWKLQSSFLMSQPWWLFSLTPLLQRWFASFCSARTIRDKVEMMNPSASEWIHQHFYQVQLRAIISTMYTLGLPKSDLILINIGNYSRVPK